MAQLTGQVAIVTGAASGIGRATAQLFAREGASVVVADINEKGGHETVRRIEETGGLASFIKTDVANSSQVKAMVLSAVETYGGLDILHANAGIDCAGKLVRDLDDEAWERVIDVNLTGVFRCCRSAIPEIDKRGGGAIVITSSDMGIKPFMGCAAYAAAKAGLISLSKILALECAQSGIRVNAIAPGETDTAMGLKAIAEDPEVVKACERWIPLKRMADPIEIAHVALFLVSKASSYITGETILSDGGRMLHDASLAKL
ncbi:MAG: SDR family oxidoreductase [Deltaproteobacteria bacterium]|nr:SDR family oxidoreductase [Deltaproteobacteria bacterium]